MNILVVDVAAESGGPLSVLTGFYEDIRREERPDLKWFFLLSTPELRETSHIRVIRSPWVKKSWLFRVFFDLFTAPHDVRKYQIDRIISLQNQLIPFVKKPQTVYIDKSLPFVDYRFPLKDTYLWVQQNVIGKLMIHAIKKAETVVVQTRWMKNACMAKTGINESRFLVAPPRLDGGGEDGYIDRETSRRVFFYPAAPRSYKNHELILRACRRLSQKGIRDFRVIFTFRGDENRRAKALFEQAERENAAVEFAGYLSRGQVFQYYTKSVLLFPSFIETFGLPLLEARRKNSIILASDCPFSREVLEHYPNARFFRHTDERELARLMEETLNGSYPYTVVPAAPAPEDRSEQPDIRRDLFHVDSIRSGPGPKAVSQADGRPRG